jgi:hypothetical protein
MTINKELILILSIIIFFNILFFIIGYITGTLKSNNGVFMTKSKTFSKHSKDIVSQELLDIDERKVITKINTDLLEKKYDTIGEDTNTKENISSAVNKLKNMKG